MIAYIIKSIVCSGIFLLLYKILLEREKLHGFNRGYLVLAVTLSLTIPLLTIHFKNSGNTFSRIISSANESLTNIDTIYNIEGLRADQQKAEPTTAIKPITSNTGFSLQSIALILYMAIVAIILFRIIKNIYRILRKVKTATCIPYKNIKLVLLNRPVMPFTFLNYVFINEEQYYSRSVNPAILEHEFIHAGQKHSLDVIFIELIKAFFFFNPCLYSYKKAMQLNHEFLADNAAKKLAATEEEYQYLLITTPATRYKPVALSNSFHYLITKKRIKMITHETSPLKSFVRKTAIVTFTIFTGILFSFKTVDKTIINDISNIIEPQTADTVNKTNPHDTIPKRGGLYYYKESIGYSENGASQYELDTFNSIISRYYDSSGKIHRFFQGKITKEDKHQLETLYKKMSVSQQQGLPVAILKPPKPFAKAKISEKLFQNFKNASIYGIWIDDHKAPNRTLEKYTAEDFSHYSVSKLYGAAKKGRSYTHQVNLMTKDYYDKYYEATINDKEPRIVLISFYRK